MTERERNGWIPASVGCYWTRDGYCISSISQGDRLGYVLTKDKQTLASFVTWKQAEAVIEQLNAVKRVN